MAQPHDPLSDPDRARVRQERAELKLRYADFFANVSGLMFAHDPIGINFTDNTDEYDPEAGTVIPRLSSCRTPTDVALVLHEEFCRWFGRETAGPQSSYEALAAAIWREMLAMNWQGPDRAA